MSCLECNNAKIGLLDILDSSENNYDSATRIHTFKEFFSYGYNWIVHVGKNPNGTCEKKELEYFKGKFIKKLYDILSSENESMEEYCVKYLNLLDVYPAKQKCHYQDCINHSYIKKPFWLCKDHQRNELLTEIQSFCMRKCNVKNCRKFVEFHKNICDYHHPINILKREINRYLIKDLSNIVFGYYMDINSPFSGTKYYISQGIGIMVEHMLQYESVYQRSKYIEEAIKYGYIDLAIVFIKNTIPRFVDTTIINKMIEKATVKQINDVFEIQNKFMYPLLNIEMKITKKKLTY